MGCFLDEIRVLASQLWEKHSIAKTAISPTAFPSAMALANSQMNRLVDQQDSPLLRLIFGEVPAYDAFVAQLACEPLHAIIKERFMNRGGVNTSAAGVVSSVARFEFVRGWPTEEQPAWLVAWNGQTSCKISRYGGLDVLRHVREQGCEWDEYTCKAAALEGHGNFPGRRRYL